MPSASLTLSEAPARLFCDPRKMQPQFKMADSTKPTGKQALRAFMGLPAVSLPPRDKKADFDRFRNWAATQANPEALTVDDFVKYNKGPYVTPLPTAPLVNLLDDDDAALRAAKKAKTSLPTGASAGADHKGFAVIKEVMAILKPVSTYKPHALPIDALIKAVTALVSAADALEKTYKTAGAKALAEAISENVALAAAMVELAAAPAH
jgi:hypothetical protein